MSAKPFKYRTGISKETYDKFLAAGVVIDCDEGEELFFDDGEDYATVTLLLPGKNEVCGECQGDGRHTNRNIDGNGITQSEWNEWDYEDRETYMSGGYDVTCTECHGNKISFQLDYDACSDVVKEHMQSGDLEDYDAPDPDDEAERKYFARWG